MLEKIRKSVESIGYVGLFASFLTIAVSFDYVYKEYLGKSGDNTPIIWACTVALGFVAFVGLLNYCVYAQSIVRDEIERVSAAKAKLEEQVLRKRLSSNTSGRRKKK
ncbi:hypothetical protein H8F06_11745 [Vibrio fluvialis]|uniref:hypothetical protein n=1 Tax=Vibrio TaxID=662 RepID=UPI00192A9AFE|nr:MULTISPECIES: hypothetical protein [Vibrio]EHH2475278.1 hypothetical protein [Vibrio vulnificus]EIX4890099.1 hypothetical protein [Vibrio vulnificus]ELR8730140.1 hypothetical protein [Vibrio vulnificus]MBL4295982.1 hypothetical protein [Vibrio fluvialis]MDS1873299.1 hypothetical protein [Vibrio vulnificus]